MKAIASPINENSPVATIQNLQSGLLLLLRSLQDQQNNLEGLLEEQRAGVYGGITKEVIADFQRRSELTVTGYVDQPTADALNRLLQGLTAIEESSTWTIQGQITDALQRGQSEYLVLVSEYDLDAVTQIAESRSNADGRFEFTFDYSERLQDSDRPTDPDLIFSISDPNGAEKKVSAIFIIDNQQEINVSRLADSDEAPIVLMNAPQNLKIRISVALTQRPITEFEELIARLSPFMGQTAFIDLKEDQTNFQISFLNKESGISKEKITQLRDAFVREREADIIPAWVFFGIASQQITFNALGSMEIAQLVQVLVPLQPSSDQESLEEIAIRLKQFIDRQTIQAKIADLKDSVGDLLQPILNSEEKLQSFLDAYARHDGAIENFWQTMSQNEQFQEYVPRIQLNLQLSQLTLNNKGLVSALQQRDISNTRQLVDLSTEDWEALSLAHVAEIPPHITGENDLERSRLYAQELQTLVEIAFPTEVIKKTLPQVEVNTFLNNNPEFDFTRTPVDTYLHEQGEQVFQGIDNPEAVTNQLQHIQRIYTLTANAKDTQMLMEMNFESAHQISKLSPDDFIQRLSGQISAENAYTYHAKAIAVSDATVMLYHQMRDLVTTVSPKAAQNLVGAPNALQNLPANWSNLFGSIDFCECKHCKSVYSPSAYFVDLLNILLGQNNGAARKELFRRRPDLKYTKLSCEHTETLIPYIDLVNEVLETYVAHIHVGTDAATEYAKLATNDTSAFTASELAANPQHLNTNSDNDAKRAYSLLKEAIFPLNLPFDMQLETARQFLLEQNSSRFELMATFGDPNSNATAAERLGISKREFEILTLKQFDGILDAEKELGSILSVSDLWGNPTVPAGETLGIVLKKVTAFLDQTDITYIELIGLLKTRFLNQYFPIIDFLQGLSEAGRVAWLTTHPEEDRHTQLVIALGSDPNAQCDLSKTELLHLNNQPLTDNELSLFNRFIRLWKKLGCSISDLDGWLTAFGATDITPQVIQDISGLWQVIKALDLSFERSAVLVGNIPAIGKDSLYAKLFLNKSILQIDNIFRLNASQRELEVSESLELHIAGILAALKISQDDFNRIVDYVDLDIATDLVNIANLSKIYRYVVFAKGLKMSIKDLVLWLGITNQAPWRNVAELVNIQELLIKLQTYDFKAAEFAYIFQDVNVSGNKLLLNDDLIQQSAKTLREGLLKIQQENSLKDGETIADFLQKELGILLEPEEVSKVVSILNGSNSPLYNFNDLLNLKTLAQYENILQDYLTPLDVNDLADTTDVSERSIKYWEKFAAKLLPLLKATFVKQHLTATFKTEANIINFLFQDVSVLQACLDLEQDTPATIQAYRTIYLLLHKCLWLVGQLKLTAKELTYFHDNPNFDTFNWKSFAFPTWLRLADYARLRDTLPLAPKDLLAIFEISQNGGDVKTVIADTTGWDATNVRDFVDQKRTSDFVNEIALIDLQKQIKLSQKIGVSLEKLTSWSSDVFLSDQAKYIKRSLKAKYDETAWVEVSTQIYNRLRSHLRDALVAFLLQKPEIKIIGLKNTNDLYGYFLIDVEMDACMQTSRLKQAIASVQLFVQRCLLNLESSKSQPEQRILPSAIDANQWKWMKNYRVWEANRKVFLYPENWIEPELRDNKSPFFKELESELLQGEITNENAEKALMNYLEKLHEVSRLDICGVYKHTVAQELHVFGRTFGTPQQYFYRKLNLKSQVWTAWEKVQADIQGNEAGDSAGVHLIPVVWNRRLYLFWPIFTEKSDQEAINRDKQASDQTKKEWEREHEVWEKEVAEIRKKNEESYQRWRQLQEGLASLPGSWIRLNQIRAMSREEFLKFFPIKFPLKFESEPPEPPELGIETRPWAYWEVRMAWSEYRNNRWSSKKVSQSFLTTPSDPNGVAPIYFYRFSSSVAQDLRIKLFFNRDFQVSLGEYTFSCNTKLMATLDTSNEYDVFRILQPEQANFYQSLLSAEFRDEIVWHEKNSLPLTILSNNSKNVYPILGSSEKEYQVLFSTNHDFSYNISSPFIYQDQRRSYLVNPGVSSKYDLVVGSQDPSKVLVGNSQRLISAATNSKHKTESSNQVSQDRSSIFSQISSENISQLVKKGEISSSDSMYISAVKNSAASSIQIRDNKSSPYLGKIDETTTEYRQTVFSVKPTLQFKPLFHAYVCSFIENLNKYGIDGLLSLALQQQSDLRPIPINQPFGLGFTNNFREIYRPKSNIVAKPYPLENIDFSSTGAYSQYNWELFFHVPMLLANRLSKNQRFEEAMRWYHFVFNPTTNESLSSTARYWQVLPFRNTPKDTLNVLLEQLKYKEGDPKRKELEDAISAWRDNPFNPHLIARMRLIAYQKNAVMKYLDNLIAWADNLFRQDTIESINQATQLYILAAELLGKQPEKIPALGNIQVSNYAELESEMNTFSNPYKEMETMFPNFSLQAIQQGISGTASILNTSIPSFYFCLPNNDKLLGYWDTVADRLFKIRHCQNIEGVERQLALFEPPIDPALLVQAVAGGVDINSVLADLNSPLPYYRFSYILQKALEICAELKSLGNSLLSALEKKDTETLSMMRTQHETMLLSLAKTVKKLQTKEAQRSREGLEKTRAVTEHRASFYTQLLKDGLNTGETAHLFLGGVSVYLSILGQTLDMSAAGAYILPDVYKGGLLGGMSAGAILLTQNGGIKGGFGLSSAARFFNMLSTMTNYSAGLAQTLAGYDRRKDDWKFQQDIATKELTQIDKQILASKIREQIAEQELVNHEQQLENARQVEDFYRNKYTQEELYGWMVGEISTIYFQCYQLAYDLAKKAEKTYRYELGLPTSNFIQFGIWDSFRKGLMSGERLYLSLKQMEKSYMDQNRREYEITKNISLLINNPLALITLKETGKCTLELPEMLFDADYPGHYMRRIKSVSITIPSVVGPYTSINCTLTLLSNKTRIKSNAQGNYPEDLVNPDNRFITNFAAMQAIATSTAQNDSGLFELNFRDERYLPFEGAGAVSLWRIDLPKDCNGFDFDTISDVILKLSYTAREGGEILKNAAKQAMKDAIKENSPLARLFSAKHEFPTQWHQFFHPTNAIATLSLDLSLERFPFQFRGKKIEIQQIELFLSLKEGSKPGSTKTYLESYGDNPLTIAIKSANGTANNKILNTNLNGIPHLSLEETILPIEVSSGEKATWSITVNSETLKQIQDAIVDLWIVCHYSIS
jgi:hypothetical protein